MDIEHLKRKGVVALPGLLLALALFSCASCSSPLSGFSDGPTDGLPADCFRMALPSGDRLRLIVAPDFGVCRERSLAGGQEVLLEFKKNQCAAVLAYLPSAPRPYGAIYPYTEELLEKDGFAAEILCELYLGGESFSEEERENVRRFNWHKLLEALRELDDPWLIDGEGVKAAIRAGKFSKSKIRQWVKESS